MLNPPIYSTLVSMYSTNPQENLVTIRESLEIKVFMAVINCPSITFSTGSKFSQNINSTCDERSRSDFPFSGVLLSLHATKHCHLIFSGKDAIFSQTPINLNF